MTLLLCSNIQRSSLFQTNRFECYACWLEIVLKTRITHDIVGKWKDHLYEKQIHLNRRKILFIKYTALIFFNNRIVFLPHNSNAAYQPIDQKNKMFSTESDFLFSKGKEKNWTTSWIKASQTEPRQFFKKKCKATRQRRITTSVDNVRYSSYDCQTSLQKIILRYQEYWHECQFCRRTYQRITDEGERSTHTNLSFKNEDQFRG